VDIDLELTEQETAALRARAEKEGRSMEDVARQAIHEYVSDRPQSLTSAIERVRSEDAELLERLSE
jgi:plasmid stability protein